MRKPLLWLKVQNHAFDRGQTEQSFAARLAAEQGWDVEFVIGAIAEYRHFLYLLAVSDAPLTPSQTIDKVWHQHLCYTENYWDKFCAKVVGRPIHHSPSLGGTAEAAKFAEAYERTLTIYREEFEEDAPYAFWPRFQQNAHQKPEASFVDQKHYWIVSKSRVVKGMMGAGVIVGVIGAIVLSNSTAKLIAVTSGIALFVGGAIYSNLNGLGKGGTGSAGCSGAGCGGHGCSGNGCSGSCSGGCGGD